MVALRPMRAGAVLSILPFFVPPTDRSRTSHTSPDTTHRLRLAEVTSHIKQLVRQGRSERAEGGSRRRGQSGSRAGAFFPRVLQLPYACPSRLPRATAPLPSDLLTQPHWLDYGGYFWFLIAFTVTI